MTLPGVSILASTFARTSMLVELLNCFARQMYAGPLELIISNQCPAQTLRCEVAGVRIINNPTGTWGDSRNRMIAAASFDLVCIWDDDDIYLPDFVALAVSKLRDGEPAARLTSVLCWDGRLASVQRGHPQASTVMRKSAMLKIGGMREHATGVYGYFWKRALEQGFFFGRHHHESDNLPVQVIRRTDTGRTRITQGKGIRLTDADYRARLLRRIPAEEPAGDVLLIPAWSQDWVAFAQHHAPAPKPAPAAKPADTPAAKPADKPAAKPSKPGKP